MNGSFSFGLTLIITAVVVFAALYFSGVTTLTEKPAPTCSDGYARIRDRDYHWVCVPGYTP